MTGYQRRTERMLLRALRPGDRAEYGRVQAVSADFFRPWFSWHADGTTAIPDFDHELERVERGLETGGHVRLVGMLAGGRIAGFFNLTDIVRGAFQSAYASWSVCADEARRGYGTEGVRGLLSLAFAASPGGLGLHRVQANVIPDNEASMRLAQKVGFRREGEALRYLHIGGEWRDHIMYALTVEEWGPSTADAEERHRGNRRL